MYFSGMAKPNNNNHEIASPNPIILNLPIVVSNSLFIYKFKKASFHNDQLR